MNPRLTAALGVAVALGLGTAGAQSLPAYSALASSLDGAAQVRAASAESALNRLNAAQTAFDQLAPSLRNQQIVGGLKDALARSRAALARTPAELQAQVLLARGLMRKALYDQSLSALTESPTNSDAQLRVLAREFQLSAASAQALTQDARAGRLERTAWRLQRAAAAQVSSALAATRAERSTAAYVNLARATSWFTVVQDASGVGTLKPSQFGAALKQLTEGDTAALSASLGALRQGTRAFSLSLAQPPASAKPATQTPAAQTPSAQTPAAQTPSGQTPAAQTPAAQAPAQTPATQTPAAPGATPPALVYAALGRALSSASHGDATGARAELADASAQLARAGSPLRDTAEFESLQGALAGAQDRRVPRPSDVQALIGGLANAERAAAGDPRSALDSAALSTAGWFSGWLRVLIFLLLAVATAAPLYLLNLAFGGRNTYWRAIMAGLALLLLPVVLEGAFGLLGALGDSFGLGTLSAATNLTLSQHAAQLPLWALVYAAAIGLLAFGFRGLCQQFGLLGGAPGSAATTAQHTSLDWDEEV